MIGRYVLIDIHTAKNICQLVKGQKLLIERQAPKERLLRNIGAIEKKFEKVKYMEVSG